MGMGGYIWIVNATSVDLKLTHQHSYQMNTWAFKSIHQQTMERFYIEYQQPSLVKTKSDDAGEATFEIEGANKSFQLQIRYPYNRGECGLKVDWSGLKSSQAYSVFPPPDPTTSIGELGWFHNGSLSLLIMEKGVRNTVSTVLPGSDSIVSPEKNLPYPQTFLYDKWMSYYSDVLGKLTLTEMTLPGTHDSGTHDPKSSLGALWIKTQSLSLGQQLQFGVRALDLRIGQNSPGDYVIVHDKWRTSYTLAAALKEITDFIDQDSTNKEIIILDFHRFVKLGRRVRRRYDYDKLKAQIRSCLTGYLLPVQNGHGKQLQEIWQTCGKGRLVVAWNTSNPDSYMWPGVNQRWYANADTLIKLYGAIKTDMLNPPSGLWASCSFMESSAVHPPSRNAIAADPTIKQWYYGGSTFCEKANIISVDFVRKYTNVVQASIIGSLLLAGAK
ncbi:uncharacterized protein LOC114520878 [Dendronephthya gigantea]|uniref:uncharacterized protein LOC114520878 n=1 Tax=Dendronephthya gigantea TaxID=151771 RepID=UPI00106A8DB1|nr:uncharacterized protein LOC114520878 [Dendronephthya gigantea]